MLTDHGLQSARWTKISSQQVGQRGGGHCGHHGGQSVGHVARTKKTPENSADKIIGHCGYCDQGVGVVVMNSVLLLNRDCYTAKRCKKQFE